MDLSERKLKILQAIISEFVRTAEPIGSRSLSKREGLDFSPATIRNEMADLEDMGYLTHPHTSAGRVPSEKAYRLYVDNMMNRYELTEDEKNFIAGKLYKHTTELNETIAHASKLLSEITNLISFAMTPAQDSEKLKYVNLLPVDEHTIVLMIVSEGGRVSNKALHLESPCDPETLQTLAKSMTHLYKGKTVTEALTVDIASTVHTDIEAFRRLAQGIKPQFVKTLEDMLNVELYMDGLTNIFDLPEYSDLDRAKMFMEMVYRKEDFAKKLISRDDGLLITIGTENPDEEMSDCSLVTATYHVDGRLVGKLGVIGPTRMKYGEVTSVLEYITNNISNSFKLTDATEGEKDK